MNPYMLILCIFFLIPIYSISQGVYFDSSFGEDGLVVLKVESLSHLGGDKFYNLLLLDDSKFIAIGVEDEESSGPPTKYLSLIKFHPDGQIDSTYGVNGVSKDLYYSWSSDVETKAAMLESEKILVSYNDKVDYDDFADGLVFRYNANGAIDSSFNNIGFKVLWSKPISDMEVDNEERILLCGWNHVVRLMQNSDYDSSFGDGGEVLLGEGSGEIYMTSISCDEGGRILLTGSIGDSPEEKNLIIVRLNEDGSIDDSFANNGTFRLSLGGDEKGLEIMTLPDGGVVVAGKSDDALLLLKLNADGTLDSSFHGDGVLKSYIEGKETVLYDTKIANEEIIVCGAVGNTGASLWNLLDDDLDFWVAKYSLQGDLIEIAIDSISGDINAWRSMQVLDGGKILTAGYSAIDESTDSTSFTLGRYVPELGPVFVSEAEGGSLKVGLFPNPVSNDFILIYNLEEKGSINVELFDINGNYIKTLMKNQDRLRGNNHERLTLPDFLDRGVYVLKVDDGNGNTAALKFLKQ